LGILSNYFCKRDKPMKRKRRSRNWFISAI